MGADGRTTEWVPSTETLQRTTRPLKAWTTPALCDLPREARGTPSLAGAYGRYSAAIRAHMGVLGASANIKLVNTLGPWTETPVAAAHLRHAKWARGRALLITDFTSPAAAT